MRLLFRYSMHRSVCGMRIGGGSGTGGYGAPQSGIGSLGLSATQSAPKPTLSLGRSLSPLKGLAPLRKYAFTFSPYRKASLPRTIPHCIRSAAAPVTKGVAKEVPVK